MEDTLLGFRVPPWVRSKDRRMIETEKFYLFDVGLANFLCGRRPCSGTPEFGKAFEHYILMELRAYRAYRQPDLEITFWRTSTGQEVDFILGDKLLAIEVKSSERVTDNQLKHLKALMADGPVKKSLVVCCERAPRSYGAIEILPWKVFLERLWAGELGI